MWIRRFFEVVRTSQWQFESRERIPRPARLTRFPRARVGGAWGGRLVVARGGAGLRKSDSVIFVKSWKKGTVQGEKRVLLLLRLVMDEFYE